jgi:protein-tyrosine phosphatase
MNRRDGSARKSAPGLPVSPRARANRGIERVLREILENRLPAGFARKLQTGRKATQRKVGMDITWVTDRIAVGGGIWNAENMAAVSRAGITHVLDMQIEFDDTPLAEAHGIEVCWNPVDDDFAPKGREVFERGVEFGLAALEEEGAKLYIHCAAGVHRAPMMALALLGVMGWTLDDGMKLIEGRRPVADFAEVYVQSVERFLRGR